MQFKQLRVEAWKSQDFNGVWTRDLAIPVRRSNQLSYEATDKKQYFIYHFTLNIGFGKSEAWWLCWQKIKNFCGRNNLYNMNFHSIWNQS